MRRFEIHIIPPSNAYKETGGTKYAKIPCCIDSETPGATYLHTLSLPSALPIMDSKTLAVASGARPIKLWDVENKQKFGEIKGDSGCVSFVVFSIIVFVGRDCSCHYSLIGAQF